MKKIQYFMLVLGVAFFLAACGSKTETQTPPPAQSKPAPAPAAKEKVKVKVENGKVGVEYEKQK